VAEQPASVNTADHLLATQLKLLLTDSRAQQQRIRDALTGVLRVLDARDSPR
jgi:hypothetical protein